ncbi:MAG: serine protein kinase [Acidobacteriota bacterium]|nr:serine protein kinase [Acidobacteriota bacterium]
MSAITTGQTILDALRNAQDRTEFKQQHWTGSFEDYLGIVHEHPTVTRTAFERLFDMILSYGTSEYVDNKKHVVHYHFFDDPDDDGRDAVYGLDIPLMKLVNIFKSAASRYGTEKRVILLHGPVGSAKSTIARLLKRGLEAYSRKPEGALYTFGWLKDPSRTHEVAWCPMHEEPLHLIPAELRTMSIEALNEGRSRDEYHVSCERDLCPYCRQQFRELMEVHQGDLTAVLQHARVKRLILSEKNRVGIGTFQPKDEKNQDSTELTGDINYRKIAEYGSESDPRAFNFDGEFNIANRGIIEFIEVLKLDVAFLYDLLGASQEHKIKPKKFPQTDIDEVIIGHTNEPEYRKLQNNEYMEALRDRTVKVDIPYITKLREEVKIYTKDYNNKKIKKHIAPHTIEMASMWAVLTRLEEPKKHNLTLLQKLKLYNGKTLPGYTEDNVKELRKEATREGLEGISPRYIQDKISNALVANFRSNCMNPFMVLNQLETGLKHHSLISKEEDRKRYRELLSETRREYEDQVKNQVQRAIAADEAALQRLCGNYLDNVKAYTQKEKVRNVFTGQDEAPDERLMRSIEEKIGIPENRKDDFRREIMNYIGALAVDNKKFDYKSNERLHKALELKLFEDQKDTIKLTSLVTSVIDRETQEKIDVVKSRLINDYGYCEVCATDVLHFVASLFARGDAKES